MYHISKRIEGGEFDQVVERARQALASQGFGVLTEIDVQATLREKLGEEMDRYLILGACNPTMAHRAIGAAPEIGVLLPCNVVVREDGGDIVVDAMDPVPVMSVVETPGVHEVAQAVRDLLAKVVDQVA